MFNGKCSDLITATNPVHLLKIYLRISCESEWKVLRRAKSNNEIITSLLICPDIYQYLFLSPRYHKASALFLPSIVSSCDLSWFSTFSFSSHRFLQDVLKMIVSIK